MAKLRLKMQEKLKNGEKCKKKIRGKNSNFIIVDEATEIDIGSILIVKASQQLSKEIEQELEEEDPVDAKQLISKNRVIDE